MKLGPGRFAQWDVAEATGLGHGRRVLKQGAENSRSFDRYPFQN
jgi:hypothetical protein